MTPDEETALRKQVSDIAAALAEAKKAAKPETPSANPAMATARQVEILQAEWAEAKKDLAEFRAEKAERQKAKESAAAQPAAKPEEKPKRDFPFD